MRTRTRIIRIDGWMDAWMHGRMDVMDDDDGDEDDDGDDEDDLILTKKTTIDAEDKGEDGDVDVIDADDCEFATTLMTNTRIVLIMTMLMTALMVAVVRKCNFCMRTLANPHDNAAAGDANDHDADDADDDR